MSQESVIISVINYLEHRGFTYIECLGEGAYGSVISVLTPQTEKVAVKIVQKCKVCEIEDKHWPILQHSNILKVTNIMTIDELNLKLYFMPVLPEDLDLTVNGDEFKSDPNSLNRVKKWFRQILSAIEYLHTSGFCHLDLKTDNVLLDEDDNAILCDFSGLNFTNISLDRLVAPPVFWPKECSSDDDEVDIRGIPFDIWSFSLLALNVLTDHYPQAKLHDMGKVKPDWNTEVWPILEETLDETVFKYQMQRAFPKVCLSDSDVYQALHFIKFVMKLQPEERPVASRVKMHPFLKTDSNPFLKELSDHLRKENDCVNPFVKMMNSPDLKNCGDVKISKMANESIKQEEVVVSEDDSSDTKPLSDFQHQIVEENDVCRSTTCGDAKNHGDTEESNVVIESIERQEITTSQNSLEDNEPQQQMAEENVICGSISCDVPSFAKSSNKNKTLSGNIYNWFRKQFNRVFKKRKGKR